MNNWIFRGWDATGQKGWVYGDLIHNQKVTVDGLEPRVMVGGYEVVPESVGLCTGEKDMDGKNVYEGDIVEWEDYGYKNLYEIKRFGRSFWFAINGVSVNFWANKFKIVGTMFENKEMIEKWIRKN